MNDLLQTAREIIRHLIARLGMSSALTAWRIGKGKQVDHLKQRTRKEAFAIIYSAGVWNAGLTDAPSSGEGSSIAAAHNVSSTLPSILDTLGSETLLDVGCGDQTWMGRLNLNQKYIGIDIVPSVVDEISRRYSGPKRRYHCLDAVTDHLPDADTVLCRDVLFHLSLMDCRALLRNVARRPRRYLIATTDSMTQFNADILSGDYRVEFT